MDRSVAEHLPLHALSFRILIAVTEGPTFGTEIVRRIEERERAIKLYPANLYRRIRDLLADGLIQECDGPAGADPRRSYVELTPVGRAVARAEAARLRELLTDAHAARLLEDV